MKEYLAGSTLLFASFTLAGQTDVYLNELQLKFTENSELCRMNTNGRSSAQVSQSHG